MALLSRLRRGLAALLRVSIILLLPAACGGAAQTDRTTIGVPERECTAALRFEEPDTMLPDADRPATRVSLVLLCENESPRRVLLGDEVGACFRIEEERALLRARCWWAGEGAMIEVAHETDALIVRRAAIHEASGISAFEEIARLEVPPRARVQAL